MGVRLIDDVQFTIRGGIWNQEYSSPDYETRVAIKKAWDSQKIRRRNFSISEDIVGKI